ncbi:MAG TPA: cysteine desulfurase family protein [Chloroflexia bacterium]|nr:cysteine desulfurase family protein [Chloroflexia bacterium]
MQDNYIYLDNAATTPLDPAVLAAMSPYFTERFYNASSRYAPAIANSRDLEAARGIVADLLKARPAEIIFTSGGSEGDNLALKGVLEGWELLGHPERNHLITTPVEHHANLYTARRLAEKGYRVTFLPVDGAGRVNPADVAAAITPQTALISVMLANNEIGTVQPVAEIGKIARAHGVPFHTDAVQAAGQLPLDVEALNIDLLTLAAHKFYGPKGVGLLYVRRGTPLAAQTLGGAQERNRRAGTENLPGIIGMVAAYKLATERLEYDRARFEALRDHMISGVREALPEAMLTGAEPPDRLPGHASFCFRNVEGETILLGLEERGILCSSGSACAAGSTEPSHVLTAIGLSEELAHTAVRFTLGRSTTMQEIDYVLQVLPEVISALRAG